MNKAEKDAKRDHMVEQAWMKRFRWMLFWALVMLGIGHKFFYCE